MWPDGATASLAKVRDLALTGSGVDGFNCPCSMLWDGRRLPRLSLHDGWRRRVPIMLIGVL